MNELRDRFLKTVTSSSNSHVIVADLDRLFDYAEFRQALIESGYRIIDSRAGLDARIKFELEIRNTAGYAALVVAESWDPLPDMKECVHFVELELSHLLPKLSAGVLKGLSFETLDLLSREKQFAHLTEDQTLSYLFRVLYGHDISSLKNSPSKEYVLSVVIDIVLGPRETNNSVRRFLDAIFSQHYPAPEGELTQVSLLRFLQEQWGRFLTESSDVEFDDAHLRKRIADLFLSGRLEPVKVDQPKCDSLSRPLSIGCYVDLDEYKEEKFASLLDRLDEDQSDRSSFDYWRQIISIVAGAALCSFESANAELQKRSSAMARSLNHSFQDFIESEYDKLFSLSGVKRPATVTRVLEHIKFHKASKKALLVLDGMTYWQWVMIADFLRSNGIECLSEVTTAYIPSITAWSRQAIFRGSMPDLSADNSKEDKLFRSYWAANGFQDYQIGFEKLSLVSNAELPDVSESIDILGLVCNDLDELMHSALGGNKKLQHDTAYWLENSSLISQLKNLKQKGFVVFITTDHGSVEATGIRNLKLVDKLGSVSRGKRHSRFSNATMLQNFRSANSNLDMGTKELSVYLKNTEAFTVPDQQVVTHGGSHFWEVLIPFAEI